MRLPALIQEKKAEEFSKQYREFLLRVEEGLCKIQKLTR